MRGKQPSFSVMANGVNWGNKLVASAARAFILIDLVRRGVMKR